MLFRCAASTLAAAWALTGCVDISEQGLVHRGGADGNYNLEALGSHPLIGEPVSRLLDVRGEPRRVYSLPQGQRAYVYAPGERAGGGGCMDTYLVSRQGTVFGYECQ